MKDGIVGFGPVVLWEPGVGYRIVEGVHSLMSESILLYIPHLEYIQY